MHDRGDEHESAWSPDEEPPTKVGPFQIVDAGQITRTPIANSRTPTTAHTAIPSAKRRGRRRGMLRAIPAGRESWTGHWLDTLIVSSYWLIRSGIDTASCVVAGDGSSPAARARDSIVSVNPCPSRRTASSARNCSATCFMETLSELATIA